MKGLWDWDNAGAEEIRPPTWSDRLYFAVQLVATSAAVVMFVVFVFSLEPMW